ncbi:MAG: hypothetical protein ACNA8W_08620 [Bradymonadaceae bacterium]
MRRLISLMILAILGLSSPAFAQSTNWVDDTAYTAGQGEWEIGLFGPVRYGLVDTVELSMHPLIAILMPNASAKVAWIRDEEWQIATRHGISYPTPLLRTLSKEGIGGVLPSHARVPHIISLNNEVLVSRFVAWNHLMTWKIGVHFAPRFGSSEWATIDLPLVYARTAAYHGTATGRVGVDFHGPLIGKFDYAIDADVFMMPGMEGSFGVEHGTKLTWHLSDRFVLQAGYKVTYGGYPFGNQFHVLPVVDMQWAIR